MAGDGLKETGSNSPVKDSCADLELSRASISVHGAQFVGRTMGAVEEEELVVVRLRDGEERVAAWTVCPE